MKPIQVSQSSWIKYNILFVFEHFMGERFYQKVFGKIEKKLFEKIDNEVKNSTALNNENSFKVIDLKKGEYNEPFIDNYSPIIFRGAAEEWASYSKWTFDFFAETFGDEDVTLINNRGLVRDTNQAYDVIKFRDYIENMRKGSKEYLKFSRILETKSYLIDDFDYKWLRKFRTKMSRSDLFYFFMGGKSTMTPVHDGYAHTVFVQIQGQKKWTFYQTSDRLFLGVRPRRHNYFYSEADISNLNDPNYPLLKYAQPITFTINPGDVLFFPSLIWHQVENTTDSIGVAYKFADLIDGFRSSKMLATLFFLSTKPTILNMFFPNLPDSFSFKKSEIPEEGRKKVSSSYD